MGVGRLLACLLGWGSNWGELVRFWNSNSTKRWGEGICTQRAARQSLCALSGEAGRLLAVGLLVRWRLQLGRFGAILKFKSPRAMGKGNLQVAGSSLAPVGLSGEAGRPPAKLRGCNCKLVDLGRFWNSNRPNRRAEGIGRIFARQMVQQRA